MNEPFHHPLTVWQFIRRHFVRIVIGAVLVVAVYGGLLVWMPYQREQQIAPKRGTPPAEVLLKSEPESEQRAEEEFLTYQREQQIEQRISENGGDAAFRYWAPRVIPGFVQPHLQVGGIYWISLEHFQTDWLPGERPKEVSAELLEEIGTLSHVEELYLGGRNVKDASMVHLGKLTKLKRLDLHHASITDVGLEPLKRLNRLEWLDIRETQVTDAGLEHLNELSNLKHLTLYGTQVTEDGRAMLQKALPNCNINPNP